MREAYFSVGEEVILVSVDHPELNGEVKVLSREPELFSPGWSYGLDVDVNGKNQWQESALRKKHKPSEFTFEQLIKQEVPVDG